MSSLKLMLQCNFNVISFSDIPVTLALTEGRHNKLLGMKL